MDDLEEAETGRELLLRGAAVGPQPGAQQRPEALGRVDVDLAEAAAMLVPGTLAPPVADGLVPVAPDSQAGVDAVLVGMHQGAFGDPGLADRAERRLPAVGRHSDHHLAATLQQAKDRRLLLRQRAAAGRGPPPPAAARAALLAAAAGGRL